MKDILKLRLPSAVKAVAEQGRELRKAHHPDVRTNLSIAKTESLSLSEVASLHRDLVEQRCLFRPGLNKATVRDDHVKFLLNGGYPALRWSRQQLRKHGILKAEDSGDLQVPMVIDYLLGPEVFVKSTAKSPEDAAEELIEKGEQGVVVGRGEPNGSLVYTAAQGEPFTIATTVMRPVVAVAAQDEVIKNDTIVVSDDDKLQLPWAMSYGTYIATDNDGAHLIKFGDREQLDAEIVKVDADLGLLLGWAIICKKDYSVDYFDVQGDHITEPCMLESSLDFMLSKRIAGEMHARVKDDQGNRVPLEKGTVVFGMPLTTEIKKALGIDCPTSGFVIGLKPNDPEILAKYESGEYTGFSIGGHYMPDFIEEVD